MPIRFMRWLVSACLFILFSPLPSGDWFSISWLIVAPGSLLFYSVVIMFIISACHWDNLPARSISNSKSLTVWFQQETCSKIQKTFCLWVWDAFHLNWPLNTTNLLCKTFSLLQEENWCALEMPQLCAVLWTQILQLFLIYGWPYRCAKRPGRISLVAFQVDGQVCLRYQLAAPSVCRYMDTYTDTLL